MKKIAHPPIAIRKQWQGLLEHYLTYRSNLTGLVLIMDSRRPLTELDWQMIGWFGATGRPIHCLLTKSDKLTKQEQTKTLRQTSEALAEYGDRVTVQLFSSLKKTGMEEVEIVVGRWLGIDPKPPTIEKSEKSEKAEKIKPPAKRDKAEGRTP
jgi:GTP-binding protein